MKKNILAILLVFAVVTAKAQDPNFSQFFASPLTINPALTGNSNSDNLAINAY